MVFLSTGADLNLILRPQPGAERWSVGEALSRDSRLEWPKVMLRWRHSSMARFADSACVSESVSVWEIVCTCVREREGRVSVWEYARACYFSRIVCILHNCISLLLMYAHKRVRTCVWICDIMNRMHIILMCIWLWFNIISACIRAREKVCLSFLHTFTSPEFCWQELPKASIFSLFSRYESLLSPDEEIRCKAVRSPDYNNLEQSIVKEEHNSSKATGCCSTLTPHVNGSLKPVLVFAWREFSSLPSDIAWETWHHDDHYLLVDKL